MKKRDKVLLLGAVIVFVICVFIGTTYAYWKFERTQENANVIVSQCFDLTFEEETNTSINLLNAYPIVDEEGKNQKPYVVHLTNKCSNDLTYQMNLEVLSNSTLNEKYVKVMANDNISVLTQLEETDINVQGAKKSYKIDTGIISANSTVDLTLRLWLDGDTSADDTDSMNKVFYSKVSVVGSINNYSGRYSEDILNGTDPVLKEGLIPVVIADNGFVYKADEKKEWYSYKDKRWANAVILEDETKVYQNGELIPEENIESYFVWIPRYKYQIFNDGMYSELSSSTNSNAVQEIKVVFESKDIVASDGVRKGQWLTHPAFTTFDVNGIWVGKFETGYKGSTDKVSAQVNAIEPEKVQIKPNVNSWRGIQVANAFYSSYDYKRNMDSHMMKNTEWGAVAYLQHSKYGSMESVRINNNENYVTGYAAINEPTCGYTATNEECNRYGTDASITQPWNTGTGYLASTTGNISGIYDMSGGAWDYVMGVMVDKNGNPMSGKNSINNSGFNGLFGCPTCDGDTSGLTELTTGYEFLNSKYYEEYSFSTGILNYDRRILGDATGEMGPFISITYGTQTTHISSWYSDEAWFIYPNQPWISRGSAMTGGITTGSFTFTLHEGAARDYLTYRVVLAV